MAFADLNKRSLDIFRSLVDAYIETGEPVGSRTISRRLESSLSPATIRNIMADLEDVGLLYAPHTSAGRLPTDAGLQFFVHGLLEVGDLNAIDRGKVQDACKASGKTIEDILERASTLLSGLSQCAGIVLAPKMESPLKQIEFVHLGGQKILVVLITEEGVVENRIVELHTSFSPSIFVEAGNYLTKKLAGKTLSDAKRLVENELAHHQAQLDTLTSKVIQEGLAVWSGGEATRSLIVKGQSNLLNNVTMLDEIDRIRGLFDILESKENFVDLLDAAIKAEGVQIFVGAEHELFKLSGCSIVVAPYKNAHQHIVGAIGVLGPTRMNYSKVIPLVDYTAKIVGKLLGGE
ncbi:MAG: heat-inducible transcriptional repressor HrcA [Alphaproteobacteria bacterium]|nr:heat-inducible transcriptional repressor HrcA [Alphaproteobacteria bacterium]